MMLSPKNNVRQFHLPVVISIALLIVFNLYVLAKFSSDKTAAAETSTDKKSNFMTTDLNWPKDISTAMDFWWMNSVKGTPLTLAPPNKHEDEDNHQENSLRTIVFPNNTKRLWIDVGVHKESDFIPNLKNESDLFLIGFEPSTKWKLCSHPHCVTLWAACTPTYDASVTLNIQDGDDLCNSVLPPQTNTTSKLWRGCVTQQKTMNVPGIPLSEVIQRVPSSVAIEFVKIDAQGFDLEVMKGLLSVSDRVQVVVLEAMNVDDPKKLLYMGQPTLKQIVEFLAKKGWKHVKSVTNNKGLDEVNAFFVYNDKYAGEVERFVQYFQQ